MTPDQTKPATSTDRTFRRATLISAFLALIIHLTPWYHAFLVTPDGFRFTGSLHRSPDIMQYRVWFRTSAEGPLVSNRFTSLENPPHLFVPFQWFVGRLSSLANLEPEHVFFALGGLLAPVFVLLAAAIIRRTLSHPGVRLATLLLLCFGGGLGAYVREAIDRHMLPGSLVTALEAAPVYEGSYRGHYPVAAYFDTHILLIWVWLALMALLILVASDRQRWMCCLLLLLLGAALPLLHIYSGATFAAALTGVVSLLLFRGAGRIPLFAAVTSALTGVFLGGIVWFFAYRKGGFAPPDWIEPTITFSTAFLAYPLFFLIVPRAWPRFAALGDPSINLFMGWAAGGLLLLLSGPFYPYSTRAAYGLALPLVLLSARGLELMAPVPRRLFLVLGILLTGATPLWESRHWWRNTRFNPDRLETFLSADAQSLVNAIQSKAGTNDIFMTTDRHLNWLGPYWPGRFEAGHWFMTPDYAEKIRNFEASIQAQNSTCAAYLVSRGITWFFVPERLDRPDLDTLPGFVLVTRNGLGALFRKQG